MDMNLAKGLGTYALLGGGLAATSAALFVGADQLIDAGNERTQSTVRPFVLGASAAPLVLLGGGLGIMAALAPFGAFSGVYGAAQPHLGGKLLALGTTGAAVAAGAVGVVAGAKALGLVGDD